MSKNLRLYLEIAEEAKRLTMEGLEFNVALRQAKEIYKEKAQSLATKQRKEHNKSFNDIIPKGTDLDNNEIYDIKSGQTIKDI